MSELSDRILDANDALIVRGDIGAIGHHFTADYVVHLTGQDLDGGHSTVRTVMAAYQKSFSDMRVDEEVLAEQGSRVAWQRTLRAIHSGAFRGFPASGRTLIWRDMVVSRFADDLIAEEWLVSDLAERLLASRK